MHKSFLSEIPIYHVPLLLSWSPGDMADNIDGSLYCNIYDSSHLLCSRAKKKGNPTIVVREWLRNLPSDMGGTGGPQASVYTVFL